MNDSLFQQKVRDSGLKYKFICEKLGISDGALIKKRKGIIPWKVIEINGLVDILHLSAKERDDIFDLKCPK